MILLFIILSLVILAGGLGGAGYTLDRVAEKKALGMGRSDSKKLSNPARELLREYRSLPIENRPSMDITSIVNALDVKHGVTKANAHFNRDYEEDKFSWGACNCTYSRRMDGCAMKDYREIHESVSGIKKALADRERALAIAGVSVGLGEIKSITEALKQERELIDDSTKQLTAGS